MTKARPRLTKAEKALAELREPRLIWGDDCVLLAAAPELLAALKEVVRIADRKTDVFDRARAAIAMAELTTGKESS